LDRNLGVGCILSTNPSMVNLEVISSHLLQPPPLLSDLTPAVHKTRDLVLYYFCDLRIVVEITRL